MERDGGRDSGKSALHVPEGGIKPHRRFSVQSKRSEVLFVDYIAEHLSPTGRAGIIVPEGIMFQSQSAYVELRKMLFENHLVAVVSLPAGVFNPYSGVKTSVLILDRSLARQSDTIGFFKVENDGFGLGAQRRGIDKNDLPKVKAELDSYFAALRNREPTSETQSLHGLIVSKAEVEANGDYNLSGERYRTTQANAGLKWPLVPLRELCLIERGASPRPIQDFMTEDPNGVNWIKIGDAELGAKFITSTKERVTPEGAAKSRAVKPGDFILSNSMSFGRPYIMAIHGCIHDGWLLLRDQSPRLDQDYLYSILGSPLVYSQFKQAATGGVVNNLNSEIVRRVLIPLPPLDAQKEIVAEIESYQKVIDGARAVLDNYRPHIPIHPDWPVASLGSVFETKSGTTPPRNRTDYFQDGNIPWVKTLDLTDGPITSTDERITQQALTDSRLMLLPVGTVLVAMYGGFNQIGRTGVLEIEAAHNQAMTALLPNTQVNPYFLNAVIAASKDYWKRVANSTRKDPNITKTDVLNFVFPFPELEEQDALVSEINAEQALVAANRELIHRFEKKIQATLSRVWGESSPWVEQVPTLNLVEV